MIGDNYTDVLILQCSHNALNVLYRDGIDTSKRLVEQYECRVGGDSSRNLCSATLTTRELVTHVLAHLLQAELLDESLDAVALILLCEVAHLEHGTNIIFDAQVTEYRSLLSKVAHAHLSALVNRQLRKFVYHAIIIFKEDAAAVGLDKSYDHIERGCLSRSVRTEQTNNLALLDIDRHMVYDRTRLIFFDQVGSEKFHTSKKII